jgi:RNA polymerase-binding protein DksA
VVSSLAFTEETMARSLATSTLKRFRSLLEEEKTRLTDVIREIEDEQEELRLSETSAERSPDPNTAEGGSLAFEIEKELSLHQNAKDLLSQAEEALERIEDGTYGICADCESSIPVARLEALPHTKLCVTCSAARH